MTPLNTNVSLFEGSTHTSPVETLPLGVVLDRIQGGTYRGSVKYLRRLFVNQDEDAYDRAKRRSMAFTPAGTFTQRNSASLETPSRCLNFDLDDLTDVDHACALIGADPHLVYMFLSPSGVGLKLSILVSGYINADTYRHAWLAVERYLVQTYPDLAASNDRACKDVSRLCYMSWDPDLYRNPDAVPFVVPPVEPPAPKATTPPKTGSLSGDRRKRLAEQAIANAIKILDASVAKTPHSKGTRDSQRLKASRLLGGYIAGGVLSEAEAKAGIAAAVERNTNNSQRAWRVIERGFQYGESVPIYLADLEAEYERWIETHKKSLPSRSTDTPEQVPDIDPSPAGHAVPTHILQHPDPRVREHWKRVYRRTAILKQRLAREGALL